MQAKNSASGVVDLNLATFDHKTNGSVLVLDTHLHPGFLGPELFMRPDIKYDDDGESPAVVPECADVASVCRKHRLGWGTHMS